MPEGPVLKFKSWHVATLTNFINYFFLVMQLYNYILIIYIIANSSLNYTVVPIKVFTKKPFFLNNCILIIIDN